MAGFDGCSADRCALGIEALERHVVAHQRHDHLARLGALAALDDDPVAVVDPLADHRFAGHPQHEVIVDPGRRRSAAAPVSVSSPTTASIGRPAAIRPRNGSSRRRRLGAAGLGARRRRRAAPSRAAGGGRACRKPFSDEQLQVLVGGAVGGETEALADLAMGRREPLARAGSAWMNSRISFCRAVR